MHYRASHFKGRHVCYILRKISYQALSRFLGLLAPVIGPENYLGIRLFRSYYLFHRIEPYRIIVAGPPTGAGLVFYKRLSLGVLIFETEYTCRVRPVLARHLTALAYEDNALEIRTRFKELSVKTFIKLLRLFAIGTDIAAEIAVYINIETVFCGSLAEIVEVLISVRSLVYSLYENEKRGHSRMSYAYHMLVGEHIETDTRMCHSRSEYVASLLFAFCKEGSLLQVHQVLYVIACLCRHSRAASRKGNASVGNAHSVRVLGQSPVYSVGNKLAFCLGLVLYFYIYSHRDREIIRKVI